MDAFCTANAQAKVTEQRADAARAHMNHREHPRTTARRIDRLQAERRRITRALDGYQRRHHFPQGVMVEDHPPATGTHRDALQSRAAYLDAELTYWRDLLDEHIQAGRWHAYTPEEIHPGDLVSHNGRWSTVVRDNRTSVSVDTGYSCTHTVKYHNITNHRPAHGHGTTT